MNTGSKAAINMTPMIDVLLVLLIIFMAIAPTKSAGLDALVPRNDDGREAAPENPVVLEVSADGSYRLNSQAVAAGALAGRLTEIYAVRGDRTLFLKGAAELEFGAVAAAIDLTRSANVERVALMTR